MGLGVVVALRWVAQLTHLGGQRPDVLYGSPLGGVKERRPSFGSAVPCRSRSIPELSISPLTFLSHREPLQQGAIDGSNLQQPAASHARQNT